MLFHNGRIYSVILIPTSTDYDGGNDNDELNSNAKTMLNQHHVILYITHTMTFQETLPMN